MIKESNDFHSVVDKAIAAGACAVDTEFVWDKTYYPTLGVVQIGLPDKTCYLIDAPAVSDWEPLARLMADAETVKILHDALQDLRILHRACGALPKNIFDSQRAAGFAGLSSTCSLTDLLRNLVRVRLEKTETRSDWLARPLTQEQIAYAEDDVRHLCAAREKILNRATRFGRREWIDDEMAGYENPKHFEDPEPFSEMPRVRGAGSLSSEQRDIIRSLAAWRDERARLRNLPRPFILSDDAIVDLARRPPSSPDKIKPGKGIGQRVVERHGDKIWAAIQRGKSGELPSLPNGMRRGSAPDDGFESRVDLALGFIKGHCIGANLDPALAGNRAEITALVLEAEAALPEDHALLRGWRREFLGLPLLRFLSGESTLSIDPKTKLPTVSEPAS